MEQINQYHWALILPVGFVLIFVIVWVVAYFLGVKLWQRCSFCGSRRTRTTKGWVPRQVIASSVQEFLARGPDGGEDFVEEINCDCCYTRMRRVLPLEDQKLRNSFEVIEGGSISLTGKRRS